MSEVSLDLIKKLRDMTGLSITVCKTALVESNGDIEKAIENLRKQGAAKADKMSDRSTGEGIVAFYVHSNNKLGAMVQIACETDFVAKNENFLSFGRDIAMHIAANNPACISPDEVDDALVVKEKAIWEDQLAQEGKPAEIVAKIMDGKEKKFREENALLKQQFVKNPEITVEDYVKETIAKMGENVKIVRFNRFSI
jgi:elongation factor Ts